MRIRVYEIKTGETIFRGNAKRTDTIESVLKKIGTVNFTDGPENSFRTKRGKTYNYFQLACEVL